jgi:tyrocidine synthetase-3
MLVKNFEEQVKKHPHKIAIRSEKGFLTYLELNRFANRVARLIEKKCPEVGKGEKVGLLFDHGINMIAAVLGTLKVGAAYVPLSVDYPENRISYMLSDSQSILLLTHSRHREMAANLAGENDIDFITIDNPECHVTDEDKEREVRSAQLAYIMYTSGSTGKPKGVMQTHENVMYYIKNWIEKFSITDLDRLTLFSSFCHDASIPDLFTGLHTGAVLYPYSMKNREESIELSHFLVKESINIWHSVPSLFSYFANTLSSEEQFKDLRLIILGGEAVREHEVRLFKKFFPYAALANLYGQTEATFVSVQLIRHEDNFERVTIGTPIDGTQIFVINEEGTPVDPLEVGEILVVCPHVSPGYWQQKEITSTAFDETEEFGKLYWTGDLGCLLPEGEIEFLGRKDFQVKIRGFRIEPAEIESQLLKHPQVKEAVVTMREEESGDKFLCAYIIAKRNARRAGRGETGLTINGSELRAFQAKELPDYMVPTYFIQLETFPLTQSGKIDRKSLPSPQIKKSEKHTGPRDFVEEKLVEIWADILKVEKELIGIDSNFFELGGHSLKATALVSRIYKNLNVKISLAQAFKTPSISGLSEYIKNAAKERYAAIQPIEKKEYYYQSSPQKRLYVLQQMQENNIGYNMPRIIPLAFTGKTAKEKMEYVFKKLIARHESLRTSFHMLDDEAVQKIHDRVEFEIEYNEVEAKVEAGDNEGTRGLAPLSPGPAARGPQSAATLISSFIRPFDLSQAPLLRVGLMKLPHTPAALHDHPRQGTYNSQEGNEQQYILMIDMHHIITDAASQGILTGEFQAFYDGKSLPLLKLQYKDYAQWQNRKEQQALITHQKTYWINMFSSSSEIPVLNLPIDYPRPLNQDFGGSMVGFLLKEAGTQVLEKIAKEANATLYMTVLSVFYLLLSKLSSHEDIIIGTPIAARRHTDLERIIGMFVNTLALRNYPSGEKTFTGFLQEVKKRTLEAFENQEYQFEELVENLSVPRDTGRNPIFDVMFNWLNRADYHDSQYSETDSNMEVPEQYLYQHKKGVSKFDITLTVVQLEEKLLFVVEYCTKLFKPRTIDRIIEYFKRIFDLIFENPDQKLLQIEIIAEPEKNRILYEFNDTDADYPKNKTVDQLFQQQAKQTPDQIALIGPHESRFEGTRGLAPLSALISITYRELNEKSQQFALLLKEKGVKPDNIVAIMLERSIAMIIGIFAILKAGGAYLPIDPQYPDERINYMLKDSNAQVLVVNDTTCASWLSFATEALLNLSEGHHLNFPASQLPSFPASLPSSLAYVIYTSGTTGKPKGVMVNHYSILRLVINTNFITFDSRDRLLQTGALDFDASTFEIWGPLLNGALLCLTSRDDLLNPDRLKTLMREKNITIMWMTAPLFNHMLQEDIEIFKGLKSLLVGGDVLSPSHIRQIKEKYPQLNVINGYGPTENTTFSTTHSVQLPIIGTIPIGTPIANSTVYILDKYDRLVPVGVTGELVVGGDGVARGYLNNPELTGEKFINISSLFEGTRGLAPLLYRTGDLARWLPQGELEYLGRIDQQVKIRGFRIELGEIENQLLHHDEIKESVVISGENENKEKYLCAYFVSHRDLPVTELREYLSKVMPDYMIPSYFVQIEKIPLTPNGKVDRKALPEPAIKTKENYTAPRDIIEKQLAEIWYEILCRDASYASHFYESIGIDDNFFELGGHSLKATAMILKIQKQFHVNLSLAQVFNTPTIRQLAEYIRTHNKKINIAKDDHLILLKKGKNNAPHLFFIHDGSGDVEAYIELCNSLNTGYSCWGIKAHGFENYPPQNITIEDLARKYLQVIKQVQTSHPYHIAGWSIGGTIAFEMVRHLERMNQKVDFLALIDAPIPNRDLSNPAGEFSLEHELDFVKNYLPGDIYEKIQEASQPEHLWQLVVQQLEIKNMGVKEIKGIIAQLGGRGISDYEHMNISASIRYLNILRSFNRARALYTPNGKINTVIHYFKASQSKQIKHENWKDYSLQPTNFYEVQGDHYSIFKSPQVQNFAKKFDQIMKIN